MILQIQAWEKPDDDDHPTENRPERHLRHSRSEVVACQAGRVLCSNVFFCITIVSQLWLFWPVHHSSKQTHWATRLRLKLSSPDTILDADHQNPIPVDTPPSSPSSLITHATHRLRHTDTHSARIRPLSYTTLSAIKTKPRLRKVFRPTGEARSPRRGVLLLVLNLVVSFHDITV